MLKGSLTRISFSITFSTQSVTFWECQQQNAAHIMTSDKFGSQEAACLTLLGGRLYFQMYI